MVFSVVEQKTSRNKTRSSYISPTRGALPVGLISLTYGLIVEIKDVIICAKFYFKMFREYDISEKRVEIWHFSLTLAVAVITSCFSVRTMRKCDLDAKASKLCAPDLPPNFTKICNFDVI